MKRLILILLAIMTMAIPTTAGDLPDTGQKHCYDGTKRIPCPIPGDDYHGQDAHYTRARSYTKLSSNGTTLPDTASSWSMVKDDVTGLIWEVKDSKDGTKNYNNPNDADNNYTWYDPDFIDSPGNDTDTDTFDFINKLNSTSFGGYSDWRMPTIKELCLLIDHGRISAPYISAYFPETQSSYYWTSSSYAGSSSNAGGCAFHGGSTYDHYKASSFFVRAVRSGQ